MKEITLSTSRIQYAPGSSVVIHGYDSVVLYGNEAVAAVRKHFEKIKTPFRNKIRSLRQMSPDHPDIKSVEDKVRYYNERLMNLNADDLKVTIITPKVQWLC